MGLKETLFLGSLQAGGVKKKGYCVENQAVVTVLVDPNSVTDPHSLPFIYGGGGRNMDLWSCAHAGSQNHAGDA